MALRFCDSVDHYLNQSAQFTQKYICTGPLQQFRVAGRYDQDGTDWAAFFMNTGFGRFRGYLPVAITGETFFSFDVATSRGTGGAFAGNSDFVSLAGYDGGTATWKEQIKLAVRANGRIQVWRSTGLNFTGALLGETAAGALEQDVWKRLTLRFNITLGLRVYLNDALVLDLSAESLLVSGSGVSQIGRVGFCWESLGFEGFKFDNVVLWDTTGTVFNNFYENLHVVANYVDNRQPASTTGAWTASTGTDFAAMLDERPGVSVTYHDSDTTYVQALATAQLVAKFRRFFPVGAIMGLAIDVVAKCAASVDVQAIVSGAAVNAHPTLQTLSGSDYSIIQFVYDTDPEDFEQWQQNDFVNQRWQFGALLTDPGAAVRLTQLVVEIVHDRVNGATADYRAF